MYVRPFLRFLLRVLAPHFIFFFPAVHLTLRMENKQLGFFLFTGSFLVAFYLTDKWATHLHNRAELSRTCGVFFAIISCWVGPWAATITRDSHGALMPEDVIKAVAIGDLIVLAISLGLCDSYQAFWYYVLPRLEAEAFARQQGRLAAWEEAKARWEAEQEDSQRQEQAAYDAALQAQAEREGSEREMSEAERQDRERAAARRELEAFYWSHHDWLGDVYPPALLQSYLRVELHDGVDPIQCWEACRTLIASLTTTVAQQKKTQQVEAEERRKADKRAGQLRKIDEQISRCEQDIAKFHTDPNLPSDVIEQQIIGLQRRLRELQEQKELLEDADE